MAPSLPGLRRRARATALPADRVEAAGPLPRGLRVIAGFAAPAAQQEICAWVEEHVAWSGGSLAGNRLETWLEGHRPLPPWGAAIGRRLVDAGIFAEPPDYLHLIAYPRGSGLQPHVDAADLGDVVAGLTLRSSRVFEFTHPRHPPVRVLLRPGDLYVLAGEARTRWQHAVPAADTDVFGGEPIARTDGLSVTWRRVRPDTQWVIQMRAEPAEPPAAYSPTTSAWPA